MPTEVVHTLRLRDGDREVEVSGSAAFVRQALDDLPTLLDRLHGEPRAGRGIGLPPPPGAIPGRTAGLSPSPSGFAPTPPEPPSRSAASASSTSASPEPPATGNGSVTSLEGRILAILADAAHPLQIAEIRRRLGIKVSGQQVRRILEGASDRVVSTGGRPAAYRLR